MTSSLSHNPRRKRRSLTKRIEARLRSLLSPSVRQPLPQPQLIPAWIQQPTEGVGAAFYTARVSHYPVLSQECLRYLLAVGVGDEDSYLSDGLRSHGDG